MFLTKVKVLSKVQLNHELSGRSHYLIQTGVRFKSSAATQRFRSKLT